MHRSSVTLPRGAAPAYEDSGGAAVHEHPRDRGLRRRGRVEEAGVSCGGHQTVCAGGHASRGAQVHHLLVGLYKLISLTHGLKPPGFNP
jgi:hypothetical protein